MKRVTLPLSLIVLLMVLAFSAGLWLTAFAALARGCLQ
jgi:hypothetical protein